MNDFQVGEQVKVFGNDKDIFEITGFEKKVYFAFGKTSEETMCILEEVHNRSRLVIHKSFVIRTDVLIDEILDQYNDYIILYELFKDECYKLEADKILEKLKAMS